MNTKKAIYNRIGKNYDATRRADPYIASRLAFHLGIRSQGVYLDAACGTGNYSLALAAKGGAWYAVDQSAQMIEAARAKAGEIKWQLADVTALPFAGAVCTLAIHHFDSLDSAFSEICRVLKKGTNFVIFTTLPEQTGNYWLADYFPRAIEKSAAQLPDLAAISDALRKAGFTGIETEFYKIRENLEDLFLYSGKFKPELYLDPKVRANISTFTLLTGESELKAGCERLAADISSGQIARVIEQHKDSDDYLFVIARV